MTPMEQAKAINENNGRCIHIWGCKDCVVFPHLKGGACLCSLALEVSEKIIKGELIVDDKCESIW